MVFRLPSKGEILGFGYSLWRDFDDLGSGELLWVVSSCGVFVEGEFAGFYLWEYWPGISGPSAQLCSHTGHSGVVCGFPLALDYGCSLNIGHIVKWKLLNPYLSIWSQKGREASKDSTSHLTSYFVLGTSKSPGNKRLWNREKGVDHLKFFKAQTLWN